MTTDGVYADCQEKDIENVCLRFCPQWNTLSMSTRRWLCVRCWTLKDNTILKEEVSIHAQSSHN